MTRSQILARAKNLPNALIVLTVFLWLGVMFYDSLPRVQHHIPFHWLFFCALLSLGIHIIISAICLVVQALLNV